MHTSSTQPPGAQPSHQAMQAAAEWFALLRSGEACAADQKRWENWLAGSDEHRAAWSYVERIGQRFESMQATPEAAATAYTAASKRMARRRMVLGIAALGGSGLLSLGLWRHSALPDLTRSLTADYRSGTGELRTITLQDGTQVWLNTASAFNLDYSNDLRRLELLSGEMLVQTAADPLRPFVVDTPHGRLRALGTRFTTQLDNGQSLLSVYDGKVEIRNRNGDTTVIEAGWQAHFDRHTLQPAVAADPAREAWSRGLIIADDLPLGALVAELRRYRRGHLGLAPEVAELRVFGSYPANDTDRALAMLESVLPVRIQRVLPWWVSIEAGR